MPLRSGASARPGPGRRANGAAPAALYTRNATDPTSAAMSDAMAGDSLAVEW